MTFEVIQKIKINTYIEDPNFVISNVIFYSEYNVCFKTFAGEIFVINYHTGKISLEWKNAIKKSCQLGDLCKINNDIIFNDGNTVMQLERKD